MTDESMSYLDALKEIKRLKEALKQQPCGDCISRNDKRTIHTDGLEEGIRCAMCTNPMANDRGCDGGCVVNESMYQNVLNVIKKQILEQEPCEDAISRQAVLDTLDKMDKALDTDRTVENYKDLLTECYKDLPPVTPKEKTGHWYIREMYSLECNSWECSECKEVIYEKTKYCPNCGARMGGDTDGKDADNG